MTQEEKQLLLANLCARLPYGVKVYGNYSYSDGEKIVDDERVGVLDLSTLDWFMNGIEIKPYLRPLSSMTEVEKLDYQAFFNYDGVEYPEEYIDWLNARHFDYRGLIKKGLAIAVTEENNPYKK